MKNQDVIGIINRNGFALSPASLTEGPNTSKCRQEPGGQQSRHEQWYRINAGAAACSDFWFHIVNPQFHGQLRHKTVL
jgi:hypothetical protein